MRKRSKRYQQAVKAFEGDKKYSLTDALALVQKTAGVKFDSSVEVHVRLGIDPKQTDQAVRCAVQLPAGTGQKKRIAAFVTPAKETEARDAGAVVVGGEELIARIKHTGKIDFDVAVAEPAMMKNLAPIAKILGTKGKMPSPKTGTLSPEIGRTIKEIAGGKVEVRNDDSGNIHQSIGKVSFDPAKLEENFKAVIEAIKLAKPKGAKAEYIRSVAISSSMGPAVKIQM